MPPAKQLTAPGLIARARKRAGFCWHVGFELGYPVCACAGAECTLSGTAATLAPTDLSWSFCSAIHH